ncbi:L,D-transpeptidase [Actinomycetes bacterium KLBMP 9759]
MGRSGRRRVMAAVGVGTVLATSIVVMTGQAVAAPAADGAGSQAQQAMRAQALVEGTPCSVTARACVDLEAREAWLIRDGVIERGPVQVAVGDPATPTPVGYSLRVYRKEQDHVSGEFKDENGQPAPMPYSVFFQDGGIAFHAGNTETTSSGCVRLALEDSKAWFASLQINDQVQVVNGSEERAARGISDDEG